MRVSRNWLQTYFEKPLPDASALADALTFHAFQIEHVEKKENDAVLEVNVLPNRAADCLSHRGIAKELSAILDMPLKEDPLRMPLPQFPKTNELVVTVDDTYVIRHTGALVRNVTVGPSPQWLTEALESMGQRSINNVVDVLNFVMLDVGQPSGAFDAGKIVSDNGTFRIDIRRAKNAEKIRVLTGEEYALSESMFVFTDSVGGSLLDIAGIKGGLASGITEQTTDLFVSAGNYDGTLVRKTSHALKLSTEASHRFQNKPSPELTAYGMRDILALLKEVAHGEIIGVVDVYPKKSVQKSVSVRAEKVSKWLGADYSDETIADVFTRLGLSFKKKDKTFTVLPPFERADLAVPEDFAEEVGRIVGYDKVPAAELPPVSNAPDQARFRGIERMKDTLVEKGFIEVSTQSFTKKGEVYLANPLDKSRPALRPSLEGTLHEALERAKLSAPLVLPPNEKPKLFEVGTVFPKENEFIELRMTEPVSEWGEGAGVSDNLSVAKLAEYGKDYAPKNYVLGAYKPFSIYPFVLRDIALWVSGSTTSDEILSTVRSQAGELLFRTDLFDTFEKNGKKSYAFRLVFQSMDRTLSDAEVNTLMEKVTSALNSQSGFSVR